MQSADVDLDLNKVALAKRPKAKKPIKIQPYLKKPSHKPTGTKNFGYLSELSYWELCWFWAKQTLSNPNFQARHIRKP